MKELTLEGERYSLRISAELKTISEEYISRVPGASYVTRNFRTIANGTLFITDRTNETEASHPFFSNSNFSNLRNIVLNGQPDTPETYDRFARTYLDKP